jgi:hypothetical protein
MKWSCANYVTTLTSACRHRRKDKILQIWQSVCGPRSEAGIYRMFRSDNHSAAMFGELWLNVERVRFWKHVVMFRLKMGLSWNFLLWTEDNHSHHSQYSLYSAMVSKLLPPECKSRALKLYQLPWSTGEIESKYVQGMGGELPNIGVHAVYKGPPTIRSF